MSGDAAPADISEAQDQLELLCRKVGLVRLEMLPSIDHAVSPPPHAALWSSSYAHLLLWPLDSITPKDIERGASEAEGWLDAALSSFETGRPGQSLDGYLIIALPTPPGDEAKEDIRRLELSARICRKHLIWPSVGEADAAATESWCRIADVTVLGLPDAVTAAGAELHWPSIDRESEAVWADLLVLGATATAQKDETL